MTVRLAWDARSLWSPTASKRRRRSGSLRILTHEFTRWLWNTPQVPVDNSGHGRISVTPLGKSGQGRFFSSTAPPRRGLPISCEPTLPTPAQNSLNPPFPKWARSTYFVNDLSSEQDVAMVSSQGGIDNWQPCGLGITSRGQSLL